MSTSTSYRPRARLQVLLAGLLYVALFAVLARPMASSFPNRITTDGPHAVYAGDSAMFVWNVHHFATSVRAGANPFRADDILAPVGGNLLGHTYTPLLGVVGLFARPIVALALGIAASFVLSGIGAFLLARRFVTSPALAALAGAIFAFCPYKLAHLLGHFNLELTATLPFYALLLLDWHVAHPAEQHGVAPRPPWKVTALAALLLALTLASDFYYTYFCIWMTLATLATRWLELHGIRASRRRVLATTAIVLTLSTVLVEVYMLRGGKANGAFGYSADLVGYLLPSSQHFLLGGERLVRLKTSMRNATIEHEVFVGLSVLALVALGLFRRVLRGPAERWLGTLGVVFLLLASPVVRIGGIRVLGFPHAVLHMLPGIGSLRVPARFAVVTMLVAGIVAMIAVERLILPRLGRVARGVAIASLAGTVLFEYARKPFDTLGQSDIPPVYAKLAALPPGTLLELPFGVRDGLGSIGDERTSAMFFATGHGKPIVGGMLARLPRSTFARYENDAVLGPLLRGDVNSIPPAEVARFVRAADVRYVILRPETRGTPLAAAVEGLFRDQIADKHVDGDWTLLTLAR